MAKKSRDHDKEHELLGQRLREAREFLGFSQEAVSQELKIPRASISAIESGKRRVSGIELREFAQLYRTPVHRLLGEPASSDEGHDEAVATLFRATSDLSDDEREQVLNFAHFLRQAGRAPALGDTSED